MYYLYINIVNMLWILCKFEKAFNNNYIIHGNILSSHYQQIDFYHHLSEVALFLSEYPWFCSAIPLNLTPFHKWWCPFRAYPYVIWSVSEGRSMSTVIFKKDAEDQEMALSRNCGCWLFDPLNCGGVCLLVTSAEW